MTWVQQLATEAPPHLDSEDMARAKRGEKPLAWQSAGKAERLPDIVVETLRARGESYPTTDTTGRITSWSVPGTHVADRMAERERMERQAARFPSWWIPRRERA